MNDTNGEYLVAFDVQDDGTLRNKRNFAKYEGVLRTPQRITSGGDGTGHRFPRTHLYLHADWHSGLQPAGAASGNDCAVAAAAEHGLRRPGQEDAVRSRSRRRIQDSDVVAGFPGKSEVARRFGLRR